jgi:hypothetical protein
VAAGLDVREVVHVARRESVVEEGELVVEGAAIESESIVVELGLDAEVLAKVAPTADLEAVGGVQVVEGVADRTGSPYTKFEGPFGGAVGIMLVVVVAGAAKAAARRRGVGVTGVTGAWGDEDEERRSSAGAMATATVWLGA